MKLILAAVLAALSLLGAIAASAGARNAYVVNDGGKSVSTINTQTNEVVKFASKDAIAVGEEPTWIAITPDGRFAYVPNFAGNSVSVINTQTNAVVPIGNEAAIKVGNAPEGIAITPDGRFAYVSNVGGNSVSVINTATNEVVPIGAAGTIKVGGAPFGIAITPDGKFAYVPNAADNSVSVINTATNEVVPVGTEAAIKVGREPVGIAIAPNGKFAYVSNRRSSSVSVINTATNEVVPIGTEAAIKVGTEPFGIAISPDQSPLAALQAQATRARPAVPVALDASASKDPDGSIAAFSWSFGDNQSPSLTTAPATTHTYAKPGSYQATLTVTDNEGCSGSLIFTGQTASCAGSSLATSTTTVNVAYPGVKVSCPKSAKPKGCSFKLQVVGSKLKKGKKAKPESAVAKAKAKAGRSAIVSLKPTKAFRKKLAAAKKVLVKETVSASGSTRTRLAELKIVR